MVFPQLVGPSLLRQMVDFVCKTLFYLCLFVTIAHGETQWSPWFDNERGILGDNETIARVRELYGYTCPASRLLKAQCRDKQTNVIFSDQSVIGGTVLRVPCNTSGLLCLDFDQLLGLDCDDFEIRFDCLIEDATNPNPKIEDKLSINGGFIAMAAGLSVVIPLVCVLIIQLRKARREERERREREASGAESGSVSEAVYDPPPSYDQLFGSDCDRTTPIRSRAGSLDVLIDESRGGGGSGGGGGGVQGRQRSSGSVGGGHENISAIEAIAAEEDGLRPSSLPGNRREVLETVPEQVDVAPSSGTDSPITTTTTTTVIIESSIPANPNSSREVTTPHELTTSTISTISGSEVSDTNPQTSVGRTGSSRTPSLQGASENNENRANSSQSNSSSQSSSSNQRSSRATEPSSSSTVSSSPSSSSSSNQPSSSSTTPTSPSTRHSSQDAPPSHPPPSYTPWRRLPGMHISIQEFFYNLMGGSNDSDNELPPPSYEEALKILEKAKLEQEKLDRDSKY